MNKKKRQEKQDAMAIKQTYQILNGEVTVGFYEEPKKKQAQPNRKGGATPTNEDSEIMLARFSRVLLFILPGILAELKQIDDPRDQSKIKYSLPMLMLFGILMFISHCPSRRGANREIAKDSLLNMVAEFVPSVTEMPHADTLCRLLQVINVEDIDRYYEEILVEFVRSKQFRELNPGQLQVAIDGTQKFSRRYQWDYRALSRNAGDEEKQQYYVKVLESVLILENGMVLPLLTEIMENKQSSAETSDNSDRKIGKVSENAMKQDCETKAFHRLSGRLAKLLGNGGVNVTLDGLYATGPIVSRCEQLGWDFMIVLKKDSLKTVWEDFKGLQMIETENSLQGQWGNRHQIYNWSNDIEYTYGNNHKRLNLNVVTCTETWTEHHPRSGKKPEQKKTNYAWLSSKRLTAENVFYLCTKVARSRWRIENNFLVEKHHGYNYSHVYSYNWNAMKGYHYLMKFGVFINVIIMHSITVIEYVVKEGFRGFVKKIWKMVGQGEWPNSNVANKETKIKNHKIKFPKLRKAA